MVTMNTVAEFLESLEHRVPMHAAGSWDPVGLQIGDPAAPASRVGVCHEVLDSTVAAAQDDAVDVIVTYHPLVFSPTTSLVAGPGAVGTAIELVRRNIALIVVHTAFDVARPGTGDALLGALDLAAAGSFGPVDDEGGADIGRIAHLDEPLSVDAVASTLVAATGAAPRVASPEPGVTIRSIGVVPGSGSSFVPAATEHVDCFVSGDITHHSARYAVERGMSVIDIGHAPSERPGVQALYDLVVEIAPEAVRLEGDGHPWRA